MFEGIQPWARGMDIARRQTAEVDAAAAQARATSAAADADYNGDVALALAVQLRNARQQVAERDERIAGLEAEVERLKLLLAVKTAHAEGRGAMVQAYKNQHPDSPLRADSGKRYKDGDKKLRIALHYESAFDTALVDKAKELGIAISNPADYRAD